jgi:hypothetical protein
MIIFWCVAQVYGLHHTHTHTHWFADQIKENINFDFHTIHLIFSADALFQLEAVSLSELMWKPSPLWQSLLYKVLSCVTDPTESA